MELKDTVKLMESKNYKERFLAEYLQLKIRYDKIINTAIDNPFFAEQAEVMKHYLQILEERAKVENINLSIEV